MKHSRNAPRKPPEVDINRAGVQGDLTWRFPDRRFASRRKPDGPAICTRCHAYLETSRWHYDERRYRELAEQPGIDAMVCPGCTRVERRLYEGEVTVRHRWDIARKEDVLRLIHNEEARERISNPTARIAIVDDRGDELYVLTTTQFLARRIGTELHKAYHGTLKVTPLPRERFSRVVWALER